jgi:type IV secretion system protein VirD4
LHYTGDRHLLTGAPTRSGKGTSPIVPNLLTYEGSAPVIDPKGENARMIAPRRGQGDRAVGFPGMSKKSTWSSPGASPKSPYSASTRSTGSSSDESKSSENVMMLADSIVIPRGGNADPFWDGEAKALLMLHPVRSVRSGSTA